MAIAVRVCTVSAMSGNQSAGTGTDERPKRLVYRLPETGQLLGGISRNTVKALIDRGELETTVIGAFDMVTIESILAYIERGKQRSRATADAA